MDDVRKVALGKLILNYIRIFNFIIIKFILENHNLDPAKYYPDGRYCHLQQVQERLYFLKFCLKVCFSKYFFNYYKIF